MFTKIKDKWRYPSFVSADSYIDFLSKKIKDKKEELSFPKKAILCYHPSIVSKLHDKFGKTRFKNYYAVHFLGEDIIVKGDFGIGAPAAVTVMEELIVCGVSEFISIGLAGAISPSLEIGNYVICQEAIREEGTSYHYAPPEDQAVASITLINRLEQAVRKLKIESHIGSSWTTDAPYRETLEEIRHFRETGVLTVEMECSALYILAKCKQVSCASLFTVSDLLTGDRWEPKFDHKKINLSELAHIALIALTSKE